MDNEDAKHTLLTIRRLALSGYPFPEGSTVDLRYASAFGLIAGIVTEALHAVQQDRRPSFVIEEKKP